MICYPVDQCPAEFVPVFREILENSWWDSPEPAYICHSIGRYYDNGKIDQVQYCEMIGWIRRCLNGFYSFGRWMCYAHPEHAHLMEENQCRKAWLEWLISPEGHYDE